MPLNTLVGMAMAATDYPEQEYAVDEKEKENPMDLKEILPAGADVREYIEDQLSECDNPHKFLERKDEILEVEQWGDYLWIPVMSAEIASYYAEHHAECDECLENAGIPLDLDCGLINSVGFAVALHLEEQFRARLENFLSDLQELLESEK